MNKFIWQEGHETVEMIIAGNPPLDEILEAFTRFLLAQGYEKPTPRAVLEFVDDEGWRE
jgi:hypothetical protein